jgi:hypothetical protein
MSSEEEDFNGRRPFTEGELIRYKKEKRKQRKEKLVQSLEKKRKRSLLEEEYEAKRKKAIEVDIQVPVVKFLQYQLCIILRRSTQNNSGRTYTISLALAGSILDNAQSPELRTYLAGQIARYFKIYSLVYVNTCSKLAIFQGIGCLQH